MPLFRLLSLGLCFIHFLQLHRFGRTSEIYLGLRSSSFRRKKYAIVSPKLSQPWTAVESSWSSVPKVEGAVVSFILRLLVLYICGHTFQHSFRFVLFIPDRNQFGLDMWFHRINSILKEEGPRERFIRETLHASCSSLANLQPSGIANRKQKPNLRLRQAV